MKIHDKDMVYRLKFVYECFQYAILCTLKSIPYSRKKSNLITVTRAHRIDSSLGD